MPNLDVDKVEVYVFRRRGRTAEFLALRRGARKSLPGVWQPVTGKIELLETPLEAAFREVREETGLEPATLWRLELTTISLDARGRALMVLPLFAAELPAGAVRLSKEHDAFRLVSAEEAAKLFLWDSQRRGLEAVGRQILPGGALAKALELPLPGRARLARATPARRATSRR